ncbi:hypothetical protein JKA73_37460 [Myxococcus xanthus]|uniref:hypothetical protein n=1 Tax=Myxococcus xanthus TaxID=34 RepID=UPI0019176345|nr:hypothetical protein [Myxococcus xanthus]QQR44574.1 hypothetical protein JKA73_37460 [Myxococcus xanthus]
MKTALKFARSQNDVPNILNTLRGPLPTATSEQLEAELMGMYPREVMEHVRQLEKESPYLLAAIAPVLAGWQRCKAEGSGLVLQTLIDMTASGLPLMVRVAATDAMGQTEDSHPILLKQLRKLLGDNDPGVRASAQDALDNLEVEPE